MTQKQDHEEVVPEYVLADADGYDSPRMIMGRLLNLDEFAHLREANLAVFMADRITQAGKVVLGDVSVPRVQGRLNGLFAHLLRQLMGFDPDFIIRINQVFWRAANSREREALVYHELCHIVQRTDSDGDLMFDDDTGAPKLALVTHDIEEFNAVAERYGAWMPDVVAFRQALQNYEDALREG